MTGRKDTLASDEPGSAAARPELNIQWGTAARYVELLDAFGAPGRPARECVRHLEEKGFSRGQARNAVYRYRQQHGLGTKRAAAHDEESDLR